MEALAGALVVLYLLIFGILLYVQYIIARKFEQIALDKGYGKDSHAFVICFLLGITGYIYVAAMPVLKKPEATQISESNTETSD